jgi:cell division protease FtsH
VAITVALLINGAVTKTKNPESLTYSQFLNNVSSGEVKTATIDANGGISGKLTDGKIYTSQIPVPLQDTALAPLLESHNVEVTGKSATAGGWVTLLESFLPLLFFLGIFLWLGRRAGRQLTAGIGGFTGSRAKLYDASKPATKFSDVAGYEGAKREVSEVVDFLKNPERYSKVGAVGPKGVLMVGPPGTGKTLMARAVAGEAGVPFFSVTGSSFIELFVGVGASRMRDLFSEARKRSPAIIFIDEIDAIGQRRGGAIVSNDEREQTLNQMLAEMDGFDPSTGVVVMAATNRPETLDKALLRPGRFDRTVEIPLPNQKEREMILGLHAAKKNLASDVDLEAVARGTPGFSGADLANLVNEAAIVAIREGRNEVTTDDFFVARDRIMLGRREATNALLPGEKRSVAVHEAGHALVAVLSEHADPVSKVTILPAGHALGVTQQLPVDERHLYAESYLSDSLAIRMGGRAAEQLVLGEVSTGAANDLAGATQLAIRMVREFGMSPRLGPVGFSSEDPAYLGDQPISNRQYAEATQRVIDEEVERLLKDANERATKLLTEHREALDRLTELLLQKETVSGEEVLAVAAGPAPAPPVDPAEATISHKASGIRPGEPA